MIVSTQYWKQIAKRTLPSPIHNWLKTKLRDKKYSPPIGKVNFGNLRRLTPISREFGYDRGLPIDRYYIENFLACQAQNICGRVLEIGDATYTKRFGEDRVTQSDVPHVVEGHRFEPLL